MTREEIQILYNQIAEKAGAWTKVTLDKDEIQDLYIDEENRIYLCGHLTPYTTTDVNLIKYRVNETDTDYLYGNTVMMAFKNNDAIKIDNICVEGIIDFKFYETRELFRQYATLITDKKDRGRYQTWKDVIYQLELCFSKANMIGYYLQQDDDGYGDVFFNNDTLFIADTVETPYKISDIESIKYSIQRIGEEDSYELTYVSIMFNNGESLRFLDDGEYDAYVKIRDEYQYVKGIKAIANAYSIINKGKRELFTR